MSTARDYAEKALKDARLSVDHNIKFIQRAMEEYGRICELRAIASSARIVEQYIGCRGIAREIREQFSETNETEDSPC